MTKKTETFDGLTAQFLAVISQKMPRTLTKVGMQRVVDNPEIAEGLLQAFGDICPFAVCGTIEVGGLTWVEFSKGLRMAVTPAAQNVLENVPVPEEAQPVRISLVHPAQLGFSSDTPFSEVIIRGGKMGLRCLHPMAGAILALLYKGAAPLNVAMGAVICSDDVRRRLVVARHNAIETVIADKEGDVVASHALVAFSATPAIKGDESLPSILEG